MKYITPELETDRLVLKRGSKEDYIKVYEYDFTKLRDVDGEFEYVKLDPSVVDSFYSSKEYLNDMFDWIIYLKDINEPIGNVVAIVKDDDTSIEDTKLKLDKANSFKELFLENIKLISSTLEVLKLDKSNLIKEEHP